MVRIPDDEFDAVMRNRYVRPMDFTGKPLKDSCMSRPQASAPEPPSVAGCRAASGSPKRRRLRQHNAMPTPRRQRRAAAASVHRVAAQSGERDASSGIEGLKAFGKSHAGTNRTSPIRARTVRDRPRRKV